MSAESAGIKIIGEKISRDGWTENCGFFPAGLLLELLEEVRRHESASSLSHAFTGRKESRILSSTRGDSTLWLDDPRCGDASKSFLLALDALRKELNRSLMLGLETVEAHYAVYPAGTSYARHRDRFRDDDTRVLSMVCYLNQNWPNDAGGDLRLYLPDGPINIAPGMGTSVFFLSDEIDHEVLPATQTRYSIAAWFRRHELQLR